LVVLADELSVLEVDAKSIVVLVLVLVGLVVFRHPFLEGEVFVREKSLRDRDGEQEESEGFHRRACAVSVEEGGCKKMCEGKPEKEKNQQKKSP
jgi:hypothetical protein